MTTDNSRKALKRTDWAELQLESLLSLPLIAEFVYRSPQTLDGKVQKEVADALLVNPTIGFLLSQKCQDDPSTRDRAKTESWARKEVKKAASQLRGALRTAIGKPVWCDHPRRGRVDFPAGLPPINHAVALIEVYQGIDLEALRDDLPLEYQGIPISYFSLNDFLNIAFQLRTLPELSDYLHARRCLPESDLRVIGNERSLLEYYFLNDGTFPQSACRGLVEEAVKANAEQVRLIIESKMKTDVYSQLMEHVADQLSTRDPALTTQAAAVLKLEPLDKRRRYLDMQAIIADLRLSERVALGKAFYELIENRKAKQAGFAYGSAQLDSKSEFVFVFVSTNSRDREKLHSGLTDLLTGAMAFYRKSRGLLILDRDGQGYDVALAENRTGFSLREQLVGAKLFGKQGVVSQPLPTVPQR